MLLTMRYISSCVWRRRQRVLVIGVLFSAILLAGAVAGASDDASQGSSSSDVSDLIKAARIPLEREIESLRERLEFFETKHETLEAATEQFRLKTKGMKQKLEDERIRYETVADEKRLLEEDMEERIGKAVQDRTRHLEEDIERYGSVESGLKTKIEQLEGQLKEAETKSTATQHALEAKLQNEKAMFGALEQEKLMVEERLKEAETKSDNLQDLQKVLEANLQKEKETLSALERKKLILEERLKEVETKSSNLHDLQKVLETNLQKEKETSGALEREKRMLEERLKEAETKSTDLQRAMKVRLQKEKETLTALEREKFLGEEKLHQEIHSLLELLSKSEREADMFEQSLKAATVDAEALLREKVQEERTRYRLLEETKAGMEETFRNEIASLSERLDDSERRAASFEQSLNATLADEQEKDEMHQKELRKRIEEASRWESRIKELSTDNNALHSRLRHLEDEALDASNNFFYLEDQFVKVQGHLLEAQEKIQQQLDLLERKAMENSKLQHELLRTKTEIETAKITEGRVTNEKCEMERLYKDTWEQLQVATAVLNQTADVSKELQIAHTRYIDLNYEFGLMQVELNATLASANRCSIEVGKLTEENAEKDNTLNVALESLNETNVARKECEIELRDIRRSMSQLLNELEVAKGKNEKTESQYQLFEAENRQLKIRYSEMEMIALQHNRDLAESRSSESELAAKLDAAQVNSSMLQARTNLTETQLSVLQKDLEDCTGMFSEMERIAHQLNVSLYDSKRENADLSIALSDLKKILNESLTINDDMVRTVWRRVQDYSRRVDYTLYQCLRWLLDLPRNVIRAVSGDNQSPTPYDYVLSLSQTPYVDGVVKAFHHTSTYAANMYQTVLLIHAKLVGGMEWISTLLTQSVQPTKKISTSSSWGFAQRWILALAESIRKNSQVIVIFGEVIATLLCLDLLVSSLIRRGSVGGWSSSSWSSSSSSSSLIMRQNKAKTMKVVQITPKVQADRSLLQKAKLSNM